MLIVLSINSFSQQPALVSNLIEVDTYTTVDNGLPSGRLEARWPTATAFEITRAYFAITPAQLLGGSSNYDELEYIRSDVSEPGGAYRIIRGLRLTAQTPKADTAQQVEYLGNGRGQIKIEILSGLLRGSSFVVDIEETEYGAKSFFNLDGIRPWTGDGPLRGVHQAMHMPSQTVRAMGEVGFWMTGGPFNPFSYMLRAASEVPERVWRAGENAVSTLLSNFILGLTRNGPLNIARQIDIHRGHEHFLPVLNCVDGANRFTR